MCYITNLTNHTFLIKKSQIVQIYICIFLAAGENVKYEDIVDKLDELALPLDAAWGVLKTFALVDNTIVNADSYSKVHDRARKAKTKRMQSKPIYNAMKVQYIFFKRVQSFIGST